MKKVGIITSDRELSYYCSLFKNQTYELVKIKSVDDFQKIKKLVIVHQPYHLLESQIEVLGIKDTLRKWLKENSILTFGFATIYVINQFNIFPIELISHKLNVLENSKVYIYPNLKPYSVFYLPNLEVNILNEKVEVLSKWKEKIIGVRLIQNVGYFFIPIKETEKLLLAQYIE